MTFYPDSLVDFLCKYPEYIPYRFSNLHNDSLKLYRRYYSVNNNIFKVIEIFEFFGTEYYNIKINNDRQAVLPYPVKEIMYELCPDHKGMKNKYIINDNNWYTGAEIKYWFFINKIDVEGRFPEFKQYLSLYNNSELNDTVLYKVSYNSKYGYGRIFGKH